VRAEAADAEDGDDGGGEGRRVGGVRVGPGDGGEGDEERLRVAARARVGAGEAAARDNATTVAMRRSLPAAAMAAMTRRIWVWGGIRGREGVSC
jgi:hypothetical protein